MTDDQQKRFEQQCKEIIEITLRHHRIKGVRPSDVSLDRLRFDMPSGEVIARIKDAVLAAKKAKQTLEA